MESFEIQRIQSKTHGTLLITMLFLIAQLESESGVLLDAGVYENPLLRRPKGVRKLSCFYVQLSEEIKQF